MKIYNENTTLKNFDAWSGAIDTKKTILEHGKADDFDYLIEDLYPEGLSETALNDILWFEEEWVYEMLDIKIEEDEE